MPSFVPPFHVDDIPARGVTHRFRVGDAEDNVVTDFANKPDADQFALWANEGKIHVRWRLLDGAVEVAKAVRDD